MTSFHLSGYCFRLLLYIYLVISIIHFLIEIRIKKRTIKEYKISKLSIF